MYEFEPMKTDHVERVPPIIAPLSNTDTVISSAACECVCMCATI